MKLNATIAADEVNAFFLSLNSMIPATQNSAMQAAISEVNQAVIQSLAEENGLPITVASHRVLTDTSTPTGKVWIGVMPVNSQWLQPFQESGTGAYAGKFWFDGAFIVDKYGNNRRYLAKRASKNQYPIAQLVTEDLAINRTMGNPMEMAGNTYLQVFTDKISEA